MEVFSAKFNFHTLFGQPMSMLWYSISDEIDIPHSPGIYSFSVILGSRQKAGLLGKHPFDQKTLITAKTSLLRRLGRLEGIFASRSLDGTLRESGKGSGVSEGYVVTARQVTLSSSIRLLESCDPQDVPILLDSLESLSTVPAPIYLGMTKEQTLNQRYFQHKSNFHSSSERDSFGYRIRSLGLRWDDLIYGCHPIADAKPPVRALETLLHALIKPPYSNG